MLIVCYVKYRVKIYINLPEGKNALIDLSNKSIKKSSFYNHQSHFLSNKQI